jgi:hypothetical protein
MGRDWPCRLVKKIEDCDHGRDSGGPAVTLKWCSRWCSEEWSTTCAGDAAARRSPRRAPLGSTIQKLGTRGAPSEADGGTRSRMTMTSST